MKRYICFLIVFLASEISAQESVIPKTVQFIQTGAGLGNNQISLSAAYLYNWNLGEKKKFFIGTGARFTSFFGKDNNYLSAPAKLANETAATDTILASKPRVNAINLLINLGYNFSNDLQAGFNIDAIGLSFGGNTTVNTPNTNTTAKPSGFNVLLVGNNDIGTLNSQFYLHYKLNHKLGVNAAYQYLFTELTTNIAVQTLPTENDRFRNKASMFYAGLTYQL